MKSMAMMDMACDSSVMSAAMAAPPVPVPVVAAALPGVNSVNVLAVDSSADCFAADVDMPADESEAAGTEVAASETTETKQALAQDQQQHQQQQQQQLSPTSANGAQEEEEEQEVDYTAIPALLDRRFEELDDDNALRPTTIKTSGDTWTLGYQQGLLSKPSVRMLLDVQQEVEKGRAFDLLDALSRSGALTIETGVSLHVILAATHCFDQSIVDTVVKRNVNPVEKLERSMLIVAGVVHNCRPVALLEQTEVPRVAQFSPKLVISNEQ